jgi:hypothetical protein
MNPVGFIVSSLTFCIGRPTVRQPSAGIQDITRVMEATRARRIASQGNSAIGCDRDAR